MKDRSDYIILIGIFILCLIGMNCTGQTKAQVINYINDSTNIQHKDIVIRQSIKETGHMKCTNCSKDVNNLFGFYWKGSYIEFDTWQESVQYYERWQGRHYKGGDYYNFLKRVGFATDPNYIKDLKGIRLN